MLIKCSECGGTVSDKAIACPHCGYPINNKANSQTANNGGYRVRKWHRLPNGWGTIRKLSGRRRNPYACYPPVKEYKDNGTPIQQPAIGYYPTWQEAYDALALYNKKPYDLKNQLTFADVYKMYYEAKFVKNEKRVYSEQSKNSVRSAFNNLKALHDKPYKDLKKADYQAEIDKCNLKHASLELMASLIKQMNTFAIENDIVEKNYGQFVSINVKDDDESGVPFTAEELDKIWDNSTDKTCQILLVLIYTGMRVSELKKAKIDYENGIITTGVKTEAGKNRIIPIHSAIADFVKEIDLEEFNSSKLRKDMRVKLSELGFEYAPNGEPHTPHDCRHTFSWLADTAEEKIDTVSKHMIMGHSLKKMGVEDAVYGHRSIDDLKKEIEKIKVLRGA